MQTERVASGVNDADLFRCNRVIDLPRLNDAELRVLRLLAHGHTAKSIANELGMTPAAVNERLREARRKTGVSSSRELARLLTAQENRDKQIGVGKTSVLLPTLPTPDAELWRPQTGVYAMVAIFLVAAAGAVALMSQAPEPSSDVDPLIGSRLERFPQPADLHAKVRAEQRDGQWAPFMESAIRARLVRIPLVGQDGNVLRITCATTLCEIAGTLVGRPTKIEMDDPKSQRNRTVQALQVPPLPDDLAKMGLKSEGSSFFGGTGKPDRLVFLLYYSRAEPKAK
jgi:DNA-binding CsgD family transcriptional regulator